MDPVLTISCPSCSRQLKLPETAQGKNVKCPVCGSIFIAELSSKPSFDSVTAKPPPLPARPEDAGPERNPFEGAEPPSRAPLDQRAERERRLTDDDDERSRRRVDEDRDLNLRRRSYGDDDDDWRPRRPRRYDDDDDFLGDRRRRRQEEAASQVVAPAVFLVIIGFLWLFAAVFFLVIFLVTSSQPREDRIGSLLMCLICFAWGGVIVIGGFMMAGLRAYGLALTASIMAMLPPCPIFNVGLGIWAIVTLSDGEVRRAFERKYYQ